MKSTPFESERLASSLDDLLATFEAKGHHVSSSMKPGINETEIATICKWFPTEVPQEIVALYDWRNGQEGDPWTQDFPFWIRDCAFFPIEQAVLEYESLVEAYGADPNNSELLRTSFPFAGFNAGWMVIPANDHRWDSRFDRPIIFVGEGVDVYFYSVQQMVETCIDWVVHGVFEEGNLVLQDKEELRIWRKHNPGIFGR